MTLVCWSSLRTPSTGVLTVIALLFATALNAWFLSIANFFVTYYTNAVTLQVLGNVKTCLSIIVSVAIFGNPLLRSQCLGVGSCLFGVWLYSKKGRAIRPASDGAEAKPKSS